MRLFRPLLKFAIKLGLLTAAGGIMVLAATYLYLAPNLPKAETLREIQLQTPLRIYSRDGLLIGEFGEQRRKPLQIDQVPAHIINAFLAAEDDRFYRHHGVDVTGLVRAAMQLVASGRIQTGGSTITMQVAKNYFLTTERTFSRKLNEIFLALSIERELTKNDILELYVNKIFLGHQAYGIEAAANVYYGTTIAELTLAQQAMIAGLPKAPSAFNPISNPRRARERRDWILGRMLKLKKISAEQYETAVKSPITASYHRAQMGADAAYMAELARQFAIDRYGRNAYSEGYSVYTTVDSRLQMAATTAVRDGVLEYDQRHGYRGPELSLTLPAGAPDDDIQSWAEKVSESKVIAIWQPALVFEVQDKSFAALLRDGSKVSVGWEQGLSTARPYVSVDARGAAPKNASDVVQRGDIVRLIQKEEKWYLSQVANLQAALVSLEADTGDVLALVGGFDYGVSSFNRITQAERQPGSNFKPFVYTAALANGFTPATIINDAPIVFADDALETIWRPTNDSGKFDGPMRLRKALYKSRNLVSIRLLRQLGFNNAINYAKNFGFDSSKLPKDLSLALGSHSMTPLEVVTGYAVFANGGFAVTPRYIDRIEDRSGEVLFATTPAIVCRNCNADTADIMAGAAGNSSAGTTALAEPADSQKPAATASTENAADQEETAAPPYVPPAPVAAARVIDEKVHYLIDSMLQDVITRGTGKKAGVLQRADAAGKTGTTNGPTDAWFSGYSGGIVTTAWAGFDNNDILGQREYGGSVAQPIWIDYMAVALQNRPERHFPTPEGVVTVRIDPDTGLLARPNDPDAIFEVFTADTAPTEISDAEPGSEPEVRFGGSGGYEMPYDTSDTAESDAFEEELF